MKLARPLSPRRLRLFAAGLAVVVLGACKPATPPEPAADATPPAAIEQPAPATSEPTLDPAAPPASTAATPAETHWQCGEQRVAARFDNAAQTVTVVHDRGEVVLAQVQAASGARYADANGNEFWTKGAEGTLTLSGTPARQCSGIAAGG